ncbi:hypothetical protein [Spirochaeta isovalerica]|uniref:Uncharacterized protein n=1 Tax=Spirochaeta isovalerica TaxID=150 RepID=A0A841R5A6_9SPIO|nr:hypothetical protein [Spirochaeta isovalerica]MBB6478571.1 hypothetical protein [Spirochaeta isovalerica]
MDNKREIFLEKQINLYSELINDLENSNINRKQRKDLKNFQDLYRQYIREYKSLIGGHRDVRVKI